MSSEHKFWIKSDDEDSSIDKYKLKKEKISSSELNNDMEIDDHESNNHAALSAPKVPKKNIMKKFNNTRKRGTVIVESD